MDILNIFMEYKYVIIFYAIIILIVVTNKKKFDFQAKFIALYRTTIGVKFMHAFADRFNKPIKWIGYAGIFLGYAGMMLIVYFLADGLYKLIFIPSAPAVLSPVIPGVPIPGSPIFVPFWYGITALFFVVLIHEFGHGVVSAAHKIKVHHSGIVFFGPLIGAFVEPDEKQLKKKSWWIQESMFAAGPVANFILAAIALVLVLFVMIPVTGNMVEANGFYFVDVTEGFPAIDAGIEPGTLYTFVNDVEVNNASYLIEVLGDMSPGDSVTVANENTTHTVVTVSNPDNETRAFMGVVGVSTHGIIKAGKQQWWLDTLTIIGKFWQWVFMLSLGIGLANLLPLGPVDGGRMLLLSMEKKLGKEKAMKIFSKITSGFFVLIMILVFVPIVKALI